MMQKRLVFESEETLYVRLPYIPLSRNDSVQVVN